MGLGLGRARGGPVGERLAGVHEVLSRVGGEHAGVHEEGVPCGRVHDGGQRAEVVVVRLRHGAGDVVVALEELPSFGDLVLPVLVGALGPERRAGIQVRSSVVLVALVVGFDQQRVLAVERVEPFAPAWKRLYPVAPCAPFDHGLVVVPADAHDIIVDHEREHGEGALDAALGDDIPKMDQRVRLGVV